MFYTDGQKGEPFFSCSGNQFPNLAANMPADSDVPPPPNPALEAAGDGHVHNTGRPKQEWGGRVRNSPRKWGSDEYRNNLPMERRKWGEGGGLRRGPSGLDQSQSRGYRQWQSDANAYTYDNDDGRDNDFINVDEYNDIVNDRSRNRHPHKNTMEQSIMESYDNGRLDYRDDQSESVSSQSQGDRSLAYSLDLKVPTNSLASTTATTTIIHAAAASGLNALGKHTDGELMLESFDALNREACLLVLVFAVCLTCMRCACLSSVFNSYELCLS